jgi:putative FmdB family regulatory protein
MLEEICNMPIYEYQCTACGEIEEAIQKFSDQPLTSCKHCSGKLTKLMSQSSFHLKGSGWYVTDYANKSNAASGKADADAKSGAGETKSATKTEKAAAKSDD